MYWAIPAAFFQVALAATIKAHAPGGAITEFFPFDSIAQHTNVSPPDDISRSQDPIKGRTICVESSPDPLVCQHTLGVWDKLREDGNITIPAGACTSIKQRNCQAVACAPKDAVNMDFDEVVGRMWTELTAKCVLAGRGGTWLGLDGDLYLQMNLPQGNDFSGQKKLLNEL